MKEKEKYLASLIDKDEIAKCFLRQREMREKFNDADEVGVFFKNFLIFQIYFFSSIFWNLL